MFVLLLLEIELELSVHAEQGGQEGERGEYF
jgi:hypothetical protein